MAENTKSPLKVDGKTYNRATYTGFGKDMQDRLIEGAYHSARAGSPDYSWMSVVGSGIKAFKEEVDTAKANKKAAREETLSGIQKEMGKPLTDKTVEAMAEDDPNKERIEAAKLKLWGEMREITNESKGRVQWKGIGPSGTGGLDPSGFLVGYGLAITPEAHGVDIGTLMATVPIIDGVESQWEDLKNVKMAAVIGKDATDEQAKQIENNLAKVSALAAENTELQEQLKTGDLGSATPAQMIRAIGSKTIEDVQREDINSLIEKNRKENERLLKESKELGMSDISAISAGIAEKPSLKSGTTTGTTDDVPVVKTITSGTDEDLSGMHITDGEPKMPPLNWMDQHIEDEKNLKKVAAEVVKKVTNGAVPEVQKVGFMEKEWVKEYIANLQKMANPFGDPNDAPLFDDVDEIEDYRDIKLLENEELKMKINRKDPNRLDKLLKAMGIDSQAATFGNLEMTGPKKILGGKNGFGTFAEKDEQIPIAQMKASVNAYMEEKYTPEELANVNKPGGMSLSQYNYEKKLAAIKIRAGEVLLVPNTSTNQLNGVTATSNQMEMEKASGTGAFTSIKQGDKIVNSSNTYTNARIGSTNEEWTQKAALANALRFSGLSFPTN